MIGQIVREDLKTRKEQRRGKKKKAPRLTSERLKSLSAFFNYRLE